MACLKLLFEKRRDCGVLGPSKDTFTSGNVIKELLLNTETIMADLSVS